MYRLLQTAKGSEGETQQKKINLDSEEREPESDTEQRTENVEKTRRQLEEGSEKARGEGEGSVRVNRWWRGVVKGKRGRGHLSAAEDENGQSVAWTERRQREMRDVREARQSVLD